MRHLRRLTSPFAFLCAFIFAFYYAQLPAHALTTAASFDVAYTLSALEITSTSISDAGVATTNKTYMRAGSGIELDYNVAIFDFKTILTLSFTQLLTSNIGDRPFTRLAIGGSYHFLRINGQRVVLDNGVEGKRWGISPALELSVGLSRLAVNYPEQDLEYTASMLDYSPRLLIEIPVSPSFLISFRGGLLKSLSMGGNARKAAEYTGIIYGVGVKLTNL